MSNYYFFSSLQDGSQNRRLKKYENDDIPQEKVARIYQEELAKIMTRRVEDIRRDGFPGYVLNLFPLIRPQCYKTL